MQLDKCMQLHTSSIIAHVNTVAVQHIVKPLWSRKDLYGKDLAPKDLYGLTCELVNNIRCKMFTIICPSLKLCILHQSY